MAVVAVVAAAVRRRLWWPGGGGGGQAHAISAHGNPDRGPHCHDHHRAIKSTSVHPGASSAPPHQRCQHLLSCHFLSPRDSCADTFLCFDYLSRIFLDFFWDADADPALLAPPFPDALATTHDALWMLCLGRRCDRTLQGHGGHTPSAQLMVHNTHFGKNGQDECLKKPAKGARR